MKVMIDENIKDDKYMLQLGDLVEGEDDEFYVVTYQFDDNRMRNLVITDHYGNMCNKKGKGYLQIKNGSFLVQYMYEYPDNRMFRGRATRPTFKNEQDAIEEVNWRREYIMKNRLKFNSKRELDEYIANNKTK